MAKNPVHFNLSTSTPLLSTPKSKKSEIIEDDSSKSESLTQMGLKNIKFEDLKDFIEENNDASAVLTSGLIEKDL